MNKVFIGEKIKTARKMSGLSMDNLVVKIDNLVSKNAIFKYEKGVMVPSSSILNALAKALDVKIDYFFTPSNLTFSQIEYRKKNSKVTKKELTKIEYVIKDRVERLLELEKIMGETSNFLLPIDSKDLNIKKGEEIEALVEKIRKLWNIGVDPIISVVELLEDQGIKLVDVDIEGDAFDGLSGKIGDFTVIAFNKNMPVDRKRLTVLHELGHLVLQFPEDLSSKEIEKLCHRFAKAFLMPREVFVREFGGRRRVLSFEELEALKIYFGASMQAIVYRAFELGLISEGLKNKFFKYVSQKGWREEEPGKKCHIVEEPTRFLSLLRRGVSEEKITRNKAAALSGKNEEEILNFINLIP